MRELVRQLSLALGGQICDPEPTRLTLSLLLFDGCLNQANGGVDLRRVNVISSGAGPAQDRIKPPTNFCPE